jgi:pimeloyl-ACP methyl ester carboxylesterase
MHEMRESTRRIREFDVHTVAWGDGQLPVVLVHGLGGNTVTWEPVGELVADALGATVTALDLPGFGLTRLPAGTHSDFRTHSRVLHELVERLGPAVVVGNSMGGSLSVHLAAKHPELVRALVLVDPAQPLAPGQHPHWGAMLRMGPTMFPPLGRFVISTRARVLGSQRLVDRTLATTCYDATRCDPELRRRLVELSARRASFPEATGAFVDSARSLFWYLRSMPADVAAISSPTLIVHGENDRLVSIAGSRALVKRRPEFTLEAIDHCGHTPQLECPDQFVDLVGTWVQKALSAH